MAKGPTPLAMHFAACLPKAPTLPGAAKAEPALQLYGLRQEGALEKLNGRFFSLASKSRAVDTL